MLVYGDASARVATADHVAGIGQLLAEAERGTGISRHGILVAALIAAGELAQGVADEAFAAAGDQDGNDPAGAAAMSCATTLARLALRCWDSGFTAALDFAESRHAVAQLARAALPESITIKHPEGFVHYAVYPEAFAAAARAAGLGPDTTVVGLRSIGTTLAAIVAAAVAAPSPGTVRPVGHPFGRELSAAPEHRAGWAAAAAEPFAVVDEGPGQSGSSVAAVAVALEAAGASADRIHLITSHANPPGPEATPDIRAVWARHPRHVRTFDDLAGASARPKHRLEAWVAGLIGPATQPLQDISGGAWRALDDRRAAERVPVHAWQERRKFLCRTESGTWLLKFAGLGRHGLRRVDRARALGEAGLTPAPAGWRHGFLVERWCEGARLDRSAGREGAFRSALARYLGFRARHFPAAVGRGASVDALVEMAAVNGAEALGPRAGARLAALRPALQRASRSARPVETDNRLHAWEWIRAGDRFLKTDALDHHEAHDLVGCQPPAWDVAGAGAEFDLAADEIGALSDAVARESGRALDAELTGLLSPIYLAFQLGSWTLAARSAAPDDVDACDRQVSRYASRLRDGLSG